MRPLAVLLAALTALMGPALAEEESFKVAVVLPYHGSCDPHWVYKAHQLPEKLQEYLSATFSEGYDIKVYPGEFETFGVTEVTLQEGENSKTYKIHQESIKVGEETLETEFGYVLKQAAQFTNKGKDGLIVILPAFLNRGGQHQGVEIPELIERVLVEDQKVPRYAYVYQQFGIASWDRQDDLGVIPELMYENVEAEEKKQLVNISDSNLQSLLGNTQNPTLKNLIDKVKDKLGLLVIAFGTLKVSYWQDYKANIEYVLKRLAEKLGIDPSKARFFAFNNPNIEDWEKSRWEIRYDNFKDVMQKLNNAGVKYVLVVPYLTVTGITDRKLFEGNPKQGEPDAYNDKEAILRHFNATLVAETQADVEKYTYVKKTEQGSEQKSVTIYINTRIYRIPKDQLGTKDDMYIIYVRRGVLDAPKAVEKVAKVLASYISLQLPTWRHRYEALKELKGSVSREVQQVKQRVEGLQGQVKGLENRVSKLEKQGGKSGKGPVLPVLALVALLPLAARRR